jgi:hypothetical protein
VNRLMDKSVLMYVYLRLTYTCDPGDKVIEQ